MSAYGTHIRQRVLELDEQGFDINEISRLLGIDRMLVLGIESHRIQSDDHPHEDVEQPTLI